MSRRFHKTCIYAKKVLLDLLRQLPAVQKRQAARQVEDPALHSVRVRRCSTDRPFICKTSVANILPEDETSMMVTHVDDRRVNQWGVLWPVPIKAITDGITDGAVHAPSLNEGAQTEQCHHRY